MPRLTTPAGPAAGEAPTLVAVPQLPEDPDPPAAIAAPRGGKDPFDGFGFAGLDDTTDYLNVLLYGREGTSKTTSAAFAANAAPTGAKVLVINAEGGLKAAALRKRGVDTSRIVVWPAPDSGVEISKRSLDGLHERLHADLMAHPGCWFAVVIDSMTDVVQALRGAATSKRVAKMRNDPKVVDKSLIDDDFVDRDDYGVMTNQLRAWFRDMRDLPCHVIVTALERQNDAGEVAPAISPALATDILGYVDITAYLKATLHATGEDSDEALAEFRALTRPGAKTRAKDRFDLTPRVLVEPTFDRILGYVRGELVEDSDPIQAAYVARRAAEAQAAAAAEAEKEGKKAARRPARGKASSADEATTESE